MIILSCGGVRHPPSTWSHPKNMENNKRSLRIYSADDLAFQKKLGQCWIVRRGRVYDVTKFVDDHPGGDDLITKFSGQDIGDAMEDESEHIHSASAYSLLEEHCIGRLGSDALIVSEGQFIQLSVGICRSLYFLCIDWVADEDFHPDDTNLDDDYLKSEFLDLRKPLLRQVWEANFRFV